MNDYHFLAHKYAVYNTISDAGVYLIFDEEKLLYVGQSRNVRNRFYSHVCENGELSQLTSFLNSPQGKSAKVYIYYLCDCEEATGVKGKRALRCVEAAAIRDLQPVLNIRKNLNSIPLPKNRAWVKVERIDNLLHLRFSVGVPVGEGKVHLDLQKSPGDFTGLNLKPPPT